MHLFHPRMRRVDLGLFYMKRTCPKLQSVSSLPQSTKSQGYLYSQPYDEPLHSLAIRQYPAAIMNVTGLELDSSYEHLQYQ